MENSLRTVALHITNECSGHCPMCYYTKDDQVKCEGQLDILKQIGMKLKKADVREINLVGGDPAEYSRIQELVEYLSSLGLEVPILSNTHNYKNTTLENISPYVSSLEGTFHASTAEEHNKFNQSSQSYQRMLANLQRYDEIRNPHQKLGVVLNIMNHNYNRLYEIVESLLEKNLKIDYVLIQRIGLYGKAKNEQEYAILKEHIITAFEQIARINQILKIETSMVDAFPLCIIPEEYHQYLGKCDWGYGTASIDMNGNITRCAVAEPHGENFLGNILVTPIEEIWEKSPILLKFRSKKYLRPECQGCDKLDICGGGCSMSNGNNALSSDILVKSLSK